MKIEHSASFGYGRLDENEPLTVMELTSVKAMVALAATTQNKSEDTIKNIVAAEFGVEQIEKIRRGVYMEVTRFLVDTQIDLLIN